MCWCWSEKPQHRPSFQEILKVLRNSAFTSMTSVVELNKHDVMAACYKLTGPHTSSPSSSSSSLVTSPRSSVTSPLPLITSEPETTNSTTGLLGADNSVLEVWFGNCDSLSVLAYHSTGASIQVNVFLYWHTWCVCVCVCVGGGGVN